MARKTVLGYLLTRGMTHAKFNIVCEYLFIDHLDTNCELSDEMESLFDSTLTNARFKSWLDTRISLTKLQVKCAVELLSQCCEDVNGTLDLVIGARVVTAVRFLILNSHFSP